MRAVKLYVEVNDNMLRDAPLPNGSVVQPALVIGEAVRFRLQYIRGVGVDVVGRALPHSAHPVADVVTCIIGAKPIGGESGNWLWATTNIDNTDTEWHSPADGRVSTVTALPGSLARQQVRLMVQLRSATWSHTTHGYALLETPLATGLETNPPASPLNVWYDAVIPEGQSSVVIPVPGMTDTGRVIPVLRSPASMTTLSYVASTDSVTIHAAGIAPDDGIPVSAYVVSLS